MLVESRIFRPERSWPPEQLISGVGRPVKTLGDFDRQALPGELINAQGIRYGFSIMGPIRLRLGCLMGLQPLTSACVPKHLCVSSDDKP